MASNKRRKAKKLAQHRTFEQNVDRLLQQQNESEYIGQPEQTRSAIKAQAKAEAAAQIPEPAPITGIGRTSNVKEIEANLKPWSEREVVQDGGSWQGMTESEWIQGQNQAASDLKAAHDYFGGIHPDDVKRTVKSHMRHASGREANELFYATKRGFKPPQVSFAVPHAKASESQWINNLRLSGKDADWFTEAPPRVSENRMRTATDLIVDGELWDVQDISMRTDQIGDPRINLGVADFGDSADLQYLLRDFEGSGATWGEFTDEIYDVIRGGDAKANKLLARPSMVGRGVQPERAKKILLGNVKERARNRNLLGPNGFAKGSFNPTLGRGEYAIDLDELHRRLNQEQFDTVFPRVTTRGNKLGLDLRLKGAQHLSNSEGLIEKIIDPTVLDDIDQIAQRQGLRTPRGTRYHANPLPDITPNNLRKGAKFLAKNWRGGLTNLAAGGASREVGLSVGKGDYGRAAFEAGRNYFVGARVESGLKALSKKLPSITAKFGTGTAGSGGLLAPVLGTVAAVEVADGLVEGFTGKDTMDHINDGIVKPNYRRTTGDTRTDAQIQANLTGPKRTYKPPTPKGPALTSAQVENISSALQRAQPHVKAQPKPATVTQAAKPQPKQKSFLDKAENELKWLYKQTKLPKFW